jgi:hypothetical protein
MSIRQITVLPPEDEERLREIVEEGTLAGKEELVRIIQYLASVLRVISDGHHEAAVAIKHLHEGK